MFNELHQRNICVIDNSPYLWQTFLSGRFFLSSINLPRFSQIQKLTPPFWANSGHLQTILSHLIPSPTVKTSLEEHLIPLQDGDRLKVYIHQGRLPVMITVFHGLSGDINSDYMQRTGLVAEQLGYGFTLVNHRGAHTGLPFAKNPYHSGKGEDASDVFEWLMRKYPHYFHIGVGISMSGSILLNLLIGRRGHVKPNAVITVNAPLDLKKGALNLSQGLNRVYDFRFVKRLRSELKQKYKLGLLDHQYKIPLNATVWDFDEIYTGPATEFLTRENYYSSCSAKDDLSKVDRPCVLLMAMDDPFVDVHDYLQAEKSNFIKMHIESVGGHLGYLGIDPKTGKVFRWLDYFLSQTMQHLVN